MKRIVRFERNIMLSTRYIGPFDKLHTVGVVDYKLKLHIDFVIVHLFFSGFYVVV